MIKGKEGRFDCADPSPDITLTSPVSNGVVFAARCSVPLGTSPDE